VVNVDEKNRQDIIIDELEAITGEQLYRRFKDGDNGAFEELVELYEDEMSRFVYGIVRDNHETEHIVIDTFAQLVLNKKSFEGKSSLKTYIFGIAKNLSMKSMKERGQDRHVSFDEIAELDIGIREKAFTALEKKADSDRVINAMRNLKSDYHAVLALLYYEDMSYKEAAKVMNKSEKQIKDLAYRAKTALKKILDQRSQSREVIENSTSN